jgi:hypothetical protein
MANHYHLLVETNREIPRAQLKPSLPAIFARGGAKAIEEAYIKHGYTMKEIGEQLDVHYATVSRQLEKLENPAPCETPVLFHQQRKTFRGDDDQGSYLDRLKQ